MKLIYLGKEIYTNRHKSLFRSFNVETVHYKNPLKAVDNIAEIEPDILYIKKDDFPRLWKIVLTELRNKFDEHKTLYILEGELNKKELKAFNFLNGSLQINKDNDFELFKEAISSIKPIISNQKVYFPELNEMTLGFIKPVDFSFISGTVVEMTTEKFIFYPENEDDIRNLELNSSITDASLSKNDDVYTLNFTIISKNKSLICEISDDSSEYQNLTSKLFV